MAWRCPGDKSLPEPMMVRLPTHICVTRPQWINKITGVVRRSECHMLYSDKNAWIFSLRINHAAEVYIQNVDIIFNSAGYYDIHIYVCIYYDIYAKYSHILARFTFCCLNSRDVFIDRFPGGFIAPLMHYRDVIMGAMASQITSLTIVCSIVYQSSASLAFMRRIHRWPVNSCVSYW